jgi:two-component system response regulator HydG
MDRVERSSGSTCEVCGLLPVAPHLKGATSVIARDPAMQELLKRVARFAPTDAPVAVLGETGTGKEVVARILHANSTRARRPFVAVNVAALPAELLESELFGHGKGAFTGASSARRGLFEEADGGTLFLDEIAEMPPPLQAKLLRVLQDGEVRRVGENRAFSVDVRIVCATHRDLAERVRQGLFREDLYYRLKVLSVHVPALRMRRDDILPLASQFLSEEKPGARGFTAQAKARLLAYAWPGNVRELQNVVKHCAALATNAQVGEQDLPAELVSLASSPDPQHVAGELKTLAEMERAYVLRVLEACGGSQSKAALVLGIARNTLWRKLNSYS